jgi:hypothetical protein
VYKLAEICQFSDRCRHTGPLKIPLMKEFDEAWHKANIEGRAMSIET